MIGHTVSHFRVLHELGRGGMGVVYEAEDILLRRKVALKFLPDELAHEPASLTRFQREARAASALNHPNICTVYEVAEQNGRWFMAMELLEGKTLDETVARKSAPLDRLLDWSIQIAEALDAAHAKGIVHRDLKPSNIFITQRGQSKVLDFGLAKMMDLGDNPDPAASSGLAASLPSTLSHSGTALGTVAFMSPEQARGEELDARSDLFSFGSVLYQMATGRLPFEGKTRAITFDAILNRDPLPIQHWDPSRPADLQRIVTKCLEKDPDLRYQHASELRADLKRLKCDSDSDRLQVPGTPGEAPPSQHALLANSAAESVLAGGMSAPSRRGSSSAWSEIVAVASRRRLALMLASLAVLVILATAALGVYQLLHRPVPLPFQGMTISSVTASGDYWSAALSPDGKYMATLRRDSQGRDSLCMSHLPTNSDTQIVPAGDSVFDEVTFSPDGNYVYYRLDLLNGVSDLYRVPVLGGQPALVVHAIDSPPAFTASATRFLFVRNRRSENDQSLITANLDGSGQKTIYSGKGQTYSNPAWSPDGKRIAAIEELPDGLYGIATIDPSGGSTAHFARLSPPALEPRLLLWMPGGRGLIALCRDRSSGLRQIAYVSYPSGKFHRITNDVNSYRGISLSADGKSIGTVLVSVENTLDIFPAGPVGDATKPVFSLDGALWLDWVGDDQIAYADNEYKLGSYSLKSAEKMTMLSDPTLLPYDPQACGPHSIVFTGVQQSNRAESHIYTLDLAGGVPRQVTFGKNDQYMRCTPDGKLLVYATFDDHSIRRLALPGGQPEILVSGDLRADNQFDITKDGKQLLVDVGGAGNDTNPGNIQFTFLSLTNGQVTKRISVDNDPEHLALTPGRESDRLPQARARC